MFGDPGPCPICGAAHSACRADTGPILVVQLPSRDAAASARRGVVPPPVIDTVSPSGEGLVGERVQATLPPGQVTSATYRGGGLRRRRSP